MQQWNPLKRDANVNRYDYRAEQAQDASLEAASPHISAIMSKLAEMRADMAAARPLYEYSAPTTFGGPDTGSSPATPYILHTPYSTDCEIMIFCVNLLSGFCGAVLSLSSQDHVPSTTEVMEGNGGQFRLYFQVEANGTCFFPSPVWFPLPASATLNLFVESNPAYITVQFRRRINPMGVPNVGYP